MNPLVRRLTEEAAAPLEDMLARLIRTAALVAMGVACAIAASLFLTFDLYLFIERQTGPLVAAGSIAAAYLLAALVFLLLGMRRRSPAKAIEAGADAVSVLPLRAASVGAQAAPAAASRHVEFAANIDAAVAPVVNVLRDAGLEREVLAIEAGTEVAKQLNPLSLVAFAAGAGVLIGRMLRSR
jgi:hypothetical protein